MARRASAILYLPLSQEDWQSAVLSFIGGEKRSNFAIEVSVAIPGGRTIALDSWTSGARTAIDLADGITGWIELRCESGGAEKLEATISVWDEQAK
ncbi:MAG: hypothetical protein ACXWML_05500 [Candidatus Binataceae bacterium]|jgi:hypothetical protein